MSVLDQYSLETLLATDDPLLVQRMADEAYQTKCRHVGPNVYLRGLIEYSNKCVKNCFYCGIRSGNAALERYALDDQEVLEAARFALEQGYGSLVIQSGELRGAAFAACITHLLEDIGRATQGALGITLSCGEQPLDVYRRWRQAGAHRYLLRIECSDPQLYAKMHPNDALHSYQARIQALDDLRTAGFQVGTGVMIGLPFQTVEHLAQDLRFFKQQDVDMVGMGPYVEAPGTPLYDYRHLLLPVQQRLELALRMVALLRLTMPDINIAATTALQTLDPDARERAILCGANVIMPNMTGSSHRAQYQLYDHKPGIDQDAAETKEQLTARLAAFDIPIGWNHWGDSLHFAHRQTTTNP